MNRSFLRNSITLLGACAASLLMPFAASAQVSGPTIVANLGGSSIATPEAICTDAYGNIYMADTGGGTTVQEIPANGGPILTVVSGLTSIRGLAVDRSGNLYIAQIGVSTILKLAPGGATSTLGSGLNRVFLMALDPTGSNLYVPDSGNNRVVKIPTNGSAQTVLPITGLVSPHGVALDTAGDVFVTSYTTGSIVELAADGVTQTTPITGLSSPYGIAINAAGALFIIDSGTGRLLEYPTPTSTQLPLVSGLGTLTGMSVALTPRGDLVYNNTSKVYSLQTGAANFYGAAVPSTGLTTIGLTFSFGSATTLGTPLFLSDDSATPLFKDAGSSTCKLNAAIAAGSTCVLNVAFTPQQAGQVSGAVNLVDKNGNLLASAVLNGVGDAPEPAFAPGTQSTLLSSLGLPSGLALDAGGNLYSVDTTNATVSKTTSASVTSTLAFTGLNRPVGVAADGSGSVYVSDSAANAIYKLTSAGVQSTVATTGLSAPKGIALDGSGNLYIADSGNSRVVRVDAAGNQAAVPLTGLASPAWLALDASGNLFVSDSGKVIEYSIAGVQSTIATPGLANPAGLAIDASGTLYIADAGNGNVYALPSASAPFTLLNGLTTPAGLALAPVGNLYVSDSTAASILLLDRTRQSLNFPSTASGATSAPLTASVQNVGNASLTYTALAVSPGFTQQTPLAPTDCSATSVVLSGAACNINILFSPTSRTTTTGTFTQTDNALNASAATQAIQLSGTGIQSTSVAVLQTTPTSGNPIYGQAITVTATVTPNAGAGTPSGTVSFAVDNGTPSAAITLSSGQATFSPPALTAGPHTISAIYSGDTNFAAATSAAFSITVTPAVLQVTAVSQTRMYNVANAALTYNITGFAYSDTVAVVSGTPSLSTTAVTTSAPSGYPITIAAGTLSASNYTFNFVAGSITVTQATNTITFPPIANVAYGSFPVALTASANSTLPITYSVVSGPATVNNGAGASVTITGAGSITLAANQPGNSNYLAATQVTQTFTAAPATLTATATSLSKQTGQANPSLTYSLAGFVNADTASVVSGAPTLSTTATTSSPTGSYPIAIAQGSLIAANYTFSFVPGTLTVTGNTAQTITFTPLPNSAYGSAPITLAATASSGAAVSYSVAGPATLAGTTLLLNGVGTVTITATQAGNSTYAAATPVVQTFTISPATLAVATPSVSRIINTPNPAFTYTITGLVNGDTLAVVSGAPAITTTATANSPVGTYPITTAQGSLAAANYVFAFSSATLTVNPAPQTITFTALPGVTYGAAPLALAATSNSTLPISYAVTGPAVLNGSILSITGAGTVSVTASQSGNATYAAATPVTQTFAVAPAPLTLTASNVTINFGSAIPSTFTYTITGFVNADPPSVVTGTPSITTSATSSSPGGTYPITPAPGTLSAANYIFANLVPGTLTISATNQTLTFAALPNIPQTTTTVTLNATASSGLAVVYTVISGPATASGNVLTITGPGVIVVTASQPGNSSYTAAAPITQSFAVTGTTTTALTSTASTINQGTGVTLTAKVTGKITGSTPTGTATFYAGSTLLGTAPLSSGSASFYTTAIPAGSITLTASYSGDTSFTASTSTAIAILVVAQDFNVSATSTNLTIATGQSASSTITLTPVGGYSQTVTFACGSLPANLQCSFAPLALNFYPGTGGSTAAQSTVVTFTATAPQAAQLSAPRYGNSSHTPIESALLVLAFPPLFFFSRRRNHRLSRMLRLTALLLTATAGIAWLSGCGTKPSIYPAAGTYNIPITFNDGTQVTHVLTVTVTIQ